ncbi:MAG: response regulator transcription factor [Verrucomicrobia bacterium]|nr:response regulator transcription factor [Verrucomicrobiota bacterium]
MKTHHPCPRVPILLRVVIADAGISINDSLTALLSEFEGVSVLGCVQESAKILTLVRTTRPDVVLLDLQSPCADALATLRHLKRLPRAPFVVVLSNDDFSPLRQAAAAAGADAFLLKATECGRIEAILRARLGAPRPPTRLARAPVRRRHAA